MPYRLAVFDFDGTLMDTRAAIVETTMRTMEAAGAPAPEPADVTARIGLALPVVLTELAGPGHGADGLCALYRAIFATCAPGRSEVFAGILELLDELRGRGVSLAIATNRSRDSAVAILQEHGMATMFAAVIGGTCVGQPKPHPAMLQHVIDEVGVAAERTLMVGDTIYDVEAGRAAGVATCAVTYGMHDRARLQTAAPTYIADAPRQVTDAWVR